MTGLIVSQVLTWVMLVAMAAALLALARQVGILHERIPRLGAMVGKDGPTVGGEAPHVAGSDLDGRPVTVGAPLPGAERTLMLFVASSCPVCKGIVAFAGTFARAERLALLLVGDGEDLDTARRTFGSLGHPFADAPGVGMLFRIGKLPYAVMLDQEGVVIAKGLVNTREHLESLVVSVETGFSSVQGFLRAQRQENGALEA